MSKNHKTVSRNSVQLLLGDYAELLFPEETAFFAKRTEGGPWLKPLEAIPKLLEEWLVASNSIESAFRNRDKASIRESMREGIAILLKSLFWSNYFPVNLNDLDQLNDLKIKPVNCWERVQFIIERPELFHSFSQLKQLMAEQQKHLAVHQAKKKGSSL